MDAVAAQDEVRRWSKEIERLRAEIRERENALDNAVQQFQLACRKAAIATK